MLSVLVVDDDPGLRSLICLVLKSSGMDMRAAAGGEEALELLKTERHPEIILLDLMMPGMDGAAFHAKAREAGYRGAVVVLSASSRGAAVSREIGADDYIQKPFDPEDLIERIDRVLTRNRELAAFVAPFGRAPGL